MRAINFGFDFWNNVVYLFVWIYEMKQVEMQVESSLTEKMHCREQFWRTAT